MSWELHEQQFESVRKLAAPKRYQYFVKKVVDWQEIWSLWDEGWALLGDGRNESVPVWPHPKFAQAFGTDQWVGYEPKLITLNDWLEKWIPGMEADHRNVAVFPTEGTTTIISPAAVKHDLGVEMNKYGQ